MILDTNGNIFGGFSPVKWESSKRHLLRGSERVCKADPSLESFLFSLKSPHAKSPRKFMLDPKHEDEAIVCDSGWGPHFIDMYVSDRSNLTTNSRAFLGDHYINDTTQDGRTIFTGSENFQVQEIEVFEITSMKRDVLPMEDVLMYDAGFELIRRVAASHHSAEMPEFARAILEYRRMRNTGQRRAVAEELWNMYVKDGAPKQCNFSSDMRANIEEYKDGAPPYLFNKAYHELVKLMTTSFVGELEKSAIYNLILAQCIH
jgi:hypothetical protein